MLDNLFESLRRLRPIKRLPRAAARPEAWAAAAAAGGGGRGVGGKRKGCLLN